MKYACKAAKPTVTITMCLAMLGASGLPAAHALDGSSSAGANPAAGGALLVSTGGLSKAGEAVITEAQRQQMLSRLDQKGLNNEQLQVARQVVNQLAGGPQEQPKPADGLVGMSDREIANLARQEFDKILNGAGVTEDLKEALGNPSQAYAPFLKEVFGEASFLAKFARSYQHSGLFFDSIKGGVEAALKGDVKAAAGVIGSNISSEVGSAIKLKEAIYAGNTANIILYGVDLAVGIAKFTIGLVASSLPVMVAPLINIGASIAKSLVSIAAIIISNNQLRSRVYEELYTARGNAWSKLLDNVRDDLQKDVSKLLTEAWKRLESELAYGRQLTLEAISRKASTLPNNTEQVAAYMSAINQAHNTFSHLGFEARTKFVELVSGELQGSLAGMPGRVLPVFNDKMLAANRADLIEIFWQKRCSDFSSAAWRIMCQQKGPDSTDTKQVDDIEARLRANPPSRMTVGQISLEATPSRTHPSPNYPWP
ncbi:hypothetical protein ACFU7T_10900 [Streptomyces sp. NPDC057555]|uniref:hypothetical protein n=1 Tax=Streptomyces sp. NPDC057555 TaxID=3346166 RepID=UPI0036AC43B6